MPSLTITVQPRWKVKRNPGPQPVPCDCTGSDPHNTEAMLVAPCAMRLAPLKFTPKSSRNVRGWRSSRCRNANPSCHACGRGRVARILRQMQLPATHSGCCPPARQVCTAYASITDRELVSWCGCAHPLTTTDPTRMCQVCAAGLDAVQEVCKQDRVTEGRCKWRRLRRRGWISPQAVARRVLQGSSA
jgi:hypothetical protein